ncbi:alanine:cation symporter family protein [Marivirga tractuosa]|uniref:alanine:cation symporter family protein n=1 Tax=Marivirga tractuosa TaxID=1006 RepID=UPI0035D0D6DB
MIIQILPTIAFEKAKMKLVIGLLTIFLYNFAVTSLFRYSYYDEKCFSYLFGVQNVRWYQYFYIGLVIWGSVASLGAVIELIDGMYALMAFPTMILAFKLHRKL